MTSYSIIAWIGGLRKQKPPRAGQTLQDLAQETESLPEFVQCSPIAMRYLKLLGPLAWECFPERDLAQGQHMRPVPFAALAAACLVKLDQHLVTMGPLRRYLVDHPALVWLLGFPLVHSDDQNWGFNADASLPTRRHFTRMLRQMPNATLQCLLDSSVKLLQDELADEQVAWDVISLDTKHILAWVKENNRKAYVSDRYDKGTQPNGDPDCRLGCKRRRNQGSSPQALPSTPTKEARPAPKTAVGEFYWGYASGVVACKVADWGEIVLAEQTQPFDQPDVSYFHPLMEDVERRLGHRPRYGALDAAFDAFYVYEYFHQAGGFAAVPLTQRGGNGIRTFDAEGLPLCQAGLAMPLKYAYNCRTTRIPHQRGRYACPLRYPETSGETCPINHRKWTEGGCVTTLATSVGARIRYQLDRESDAYKAVYKQRTATERINSQAVALGIERPKLRNGQAIANLNTLTYVLINLYTLQRIRQLKAERSAGSDQD